MIGLASRRDAPYVCRWLGYNYAKQKHLGCKKVPGQSEATPQTGRREQKI